MSQLQGKIVLLTGGGSGIGLASAKFLLQDGAKVILVGRTEAKLKEAASSLGSNCSFQVADVGNENQVQAMVQKVVSAHGAIDILVNNAGTNIKERTFRELTPENWRKLIHANLDGAFYCIHAVLPHMLKRGDGLIINISSIAGKRASPLGGAAYVASKFGMTGLGLCLGVEEKDSGLRVTNIYPGEVDTPILAARPTPLSAEQRRKILQPEDVAAAVLFVATLPPHVSVPELIIKPTAQVYM